MFWYWYKLTCWFKHVIHKSRTQVIEIFKCHWANTMLCKVSNFTCVKLWRHTSLVLWITYFLHCNWYLFVLWIFLLWITCFSSLYLKTVKKNYIAKCDSVEGLFIDYFCLIIWYSTWSCLSCYYFCKGKNGVYKPLFFKTFHSVF